MRLWLAFLFDIHAPLVFFLLQTLFCFICILHASVSQDSYDVKKLSDIFVEQNNTPNRRAGSKLAVFHGTLSNSETYLPRSYISVHFTMYSKHTLCKNTSGLNTDLVLLGVCTILSVHKNLLYFIGDGTCLKFKSQIFNFG